MRTHTHTHTHTHACTYPSTFLQLVNGSKNSNLELSFEAQSLQVSLSNFFVCLPRQIFYSFTPLLLL